ncbi:4-aminobutyrate--2-oxoglutarate transaminase [Guptibacillus algicola]|uniref:4-aminobutyrate--2-oxoglutarate transaminase n=1 Tax=Guptibacillus algicola TaxID=225844 RepID=UPI001CD7D64E|nr:4-aminobutyrate--2-oxoglutarate transaminase [Alkalihalobacillus algicola]MCA0986993.1 4-aminobutyrate--2-oxoglutarate transaminase [Alkalihalobacillus algicola]
MRHASINTPLPGPKASDLLERRKKIVPDAVSYGIPTFAREAHGAKVTDVDGNTFIDFAGAIGTINVGHCHPKVKDALHDQVEKYIHTGFNVMMYEPYIALAEKLAELAPGSHDKKVLLQNSGAEAVENAVKIARKYTGRQAIVTFANAFHGRTLMTMSMTSKVKPYKFGFGPFAPEVYKAPFPYAYRRPDNMTEKEYSDFMIDQFKDFLLKEVAPETIAAVVMEPIQGEGGFIVPDKAFVQTVKELCAEHGILFVADEIQTGFARTGAYFASEHFDIVPDLITVSKSLGAGMPISGVIGRKEMMDAANAGELGGTYSGNPLGCRAALAAIDIIEEEKLNDRANEIGQKVKETFHTLSGEVDCIGDIRGIGAMVAVEIVSDLEKKTPAKSLAAQMISTAQQQGLLVLGAGVYGNVIRFLMPLVITDEELDEGLSIIESAVRTVWNTTLVTSNE